MAAIHTNKDSNGNTIATHSDTAPSGWWMSSTSGPTGNETPPREKLLNRKERRALARKKK